MPRKSTAKAATPTPTVTPTVPTTNPEVISTELVDDKFHLSIDFGDTQAEAEGDSVYEALKSIEKPVKIVAKTFIKVRKGDKKVDILMMPARSKRLFFPSAQLYLSKQLEYLMK
jgi:hypothetical protein